VSQFLQLNHENLNPFYGLVVEPPNLSELIYYGKHGSLQDVLDDANMDLTIEFMISFAQDVAKVTYLF